MKTLCEFCVFNTKENNKQTGCELNRLDKYEKELVGNNYQLNGYCQFIRNGYWLGVDKPNRIDLVNAECEVKYAVIYGYDGDKAKLTKTLNSVSGGFQPQDFVICFDDKLDISISDLHAEFKGYVNNLYITQAIDTEHNYDNVYEMAMKQTNANFMYFIEAGEEIDKKCMSHLNSLINDEIKSVYLVRGDNFTICLKKLFQQYAYMEQPMSKLYNALINSKYKDSVIQW